MPKIGKCGATYHVTPELQYAELPRGSSHLCLSQHGGTVVPRTNCTIGLTLHVAVRSASVPPTYNSFCVSSNRLLLGARSLGARRLRCCPMQDQIVLSDPPKVDQKLNLAKIACGAVQRQESHEREEGKEDGEQDGECDEGSERTEKPRGTFV